MRFSRRAMSGISTLIIFIALILVASVAAFVILQTAGTLQSQAILTGNESRSEVSTRVFLLNVLGDTQDKNAVHRIRLILKLAPGSDPVNLPRSFLHYSDGNVFHTAIQYLDPNETYYDNTPAKAIEAANETHFTAHFLRRPGDWPVSQRINISPEDIVEIYYPINPTYPGTLIFLQFIPDRGSGTPAEFRVIQNLDNNTVNLFP